MLRLYRNTLRVVIAPDRVVLVRTSRWRKTVLEQSVIAVTDAGELPWHGAIDALARALKNAAWQGCDVHVVLSDRLVRYLLAPIPKGGTLAKIDGRQVASHYFKETYGDMASNWACLLDESGSGEWCLATAVDRDLISSIAGCCATPGFRLVSLTPALVVAFNQFRTAWRSGSHWFAVVEARSACLCLYQEGAWRQVRSIECDDVGAEMARVVARENLLAGMENTQAHSVSLLALDTLDHGAMTQQGLDVKRLSLPAAPNGRSESSRIALALVA